MNANRLLLTVAVVLFLSPMARGAEIEPLPAEAAAGLAGKLVELARKIEKPQIVIGADAAKAGGVHVPDKLGALVVPQQGLVEGAELAEKFKSDKGAPLGYLFAYRLTPIVDGKQVAAERLRTVKLSGEGQEAELVVLLLAVKQLDEGDYRLHAYGSGAEPVVEARFSQQDAEVSKPVAVEIKNVDEQTRQGDAVITVFGQFQARFRMQYEEK